MEKLIHDFWGDATLIDKIGIIGGWFVIIGAIIALFFFKDYI